MFLKRFLLNFLDKEEDFRETFEKYTIHFLEKGIPSLVNDIETIFATNELKLKVITEIFEKFLCSIQKDMTLCGEEKDPMQECFLLFYLAQIRFLEGNYFSALDLTSEAIEHTPTFIEAWQFKAKIYAALGDDSAAEEAFISAHSLDTADRFLNAECARYVLKNGKHEEANDIMKRWSIDQQTDELNTFDLQNIWYEVESANSYYAKGEYLKAFQLFNFIQKHIDTMHKDVYDLHFYTIRKFNLRAYMNIKNMQDSIRKNIYVQKGMIGYIKVCNKFYQKSENVTEEEKEEFEKWVKEEDDKHEEKKIDTNEWDEYEPPHDPLDKLTDPSGIKDLKKILEAGIVKTLAEK